AQYDRLAAGIRRRARLPAGEIERKVYPEGERGLRILTPVRGRDVVLLGGTYSDSALADMFDLACGMVQDGCRSLTLLVPYFGGSTAERSVRPGDVVIAKNRARILSAIPRAPGGNRIALLDLHSEGIAYYFDDPMIPTLLRAQPVTLAAARSLAPDGIVLACTDAGRAKWVESLANDLRVPAAFILKRRVSATRTEVTAANADVRDKTVVIYDDMVRSGGSLLSAADAYRKAGARSVSAVVTHAVFAPGALDALQRSGLLRRLVATDSHPSALAQPKTPFFQVRSCAEIFADYLKASR
ncbi:MAG TPA: ribose-phosphate diphosphokinase, partial [Elusimicrobiota bacterium]|nr:ribose-phosphate diphosphokinase [Elusimicrobiota bacterium]